MHTKPNSNTIASVKFTVIIPTYNRADKLKNCLKSLENQTFKDFEVVVADDGSTDHTKAITESFMNSRLNLRYIYNNNWGGPAFPRNKGIEAATGEWLCFLDADDWWYPAKLAVVAAHCNDTTDFVYHDFDIYVNGKKNGKQHTGRTLKTPVFEDLFINDNCIVNSGACVRTSLIRQCGGFSEDREMIAVEDYDLWLRCAKQTNRFKYVSQILGGYDESGVDNITAQDNRQIKRIDRIFAAHVTSLKSADLIQQATYNWSYKKALIYLKMQDLKTARALLKQSACSRNGRIRLKSAMQYLRTFI
ncbi:glycosyltransferase family 2 protein [Chitinophaga deserti]|uniref:glycosyltransferase family 2 protein n=1 Tax=Chitinophaga deserti TaxID=2164099 RepID=UPI001300594D|nr:glycosyltransferase [Chitinophaga deserti]